MNAVKYFKTISQQYSSHMMNTMKRATPRPSTISSICKPPKFILAAVPAVALSASQDETRLDAIPPSPYARSKHLDISRNTLRMSMDSMEDFDANISETCLSIGASVIPHPAKRAKGGEDAYFFSSDMRIIGVADGVGGWADLGVDPADYSKSLMEGARLAAECTKDPRTILAEGYKYSLNVTGSSTCCVCSLDGSVLRAVNLGDSGFMVIRGSRIVYRSSEQQHAFNSPFQLGTGSTDLPEHAQSIEVNVVPGDLIVIGTDGLFDNLFDDEILEVAQQADEPIMIAQLIARQASLVASDKAALSPFSHIARQCGWPQAIGGKLDDITVLVARVVLDSDISMAA